MCFMALQITDVYAVTYETCGKYWPYIHHYILIAIILMQITMIGLFGLKSKPAASVCTVPLLLFSLLFHGYCKLRFYPTFRNYSIQVFMQLCCCYFIYYSGHPNVLNMNFLDVCASFTNGLSLVVFGLFMHWRLSMSTWSFSPILLVCYSLTRKAFRFWMLVKVGTWTENEGKYLIN